MTILNFTDLTVLCDELLDEGARYVSDNSQQIPRGVKTQVKHARESLIKKLNELKKKAAIAAVHEIRLLNCKDILAGGIHMLSIKKIEALVAEIKRNKELAARYSVTEDDVDNCFGLCFNYESVLIRIRTHLSR